MRMAFDTTSKNYETNNKVMSPDQFEQVVRAILEGKYSWACVLILRFAGYNPAHYIPYRTYKRLIKSNRSGEISQASANGELQSLKQSSISAS
jgi:hypothetical protein